MKKILSLALCIIFALVLFTTSVSAATYTFESFVDGNGYGTKTQVSENVINLKGESTAVGGMYVGPYSKASTSKLKDGILEESYVEVKMDEVSVGEFFEVSLALKNASNEYVTEAVVMSQKTAKNEISLTAGWAPNFKAIINKDGIYTYQWKMFVENNKPYVNFTLLSGNTVIGTTGNIDMDTINGPDDKNPILEQEDVSVKYLWFCNIAQKAGVNVYTQLPKTEIEFVQKEDSVVFVENAEETKEVLKNSLENNGIALNPADKVEINVKVSDLPEQDGEEMKEAVTEKVNGANIVGLYDITIPVTVNGEIVGDLSKLSEKIELKLPIPEGLPEVSEGYNRVYYVVKEHNGEIELLNAIVNSDNTVSFETDEFSRYALAYVDEKNETPNQPQQGENEEQNQTPEKDETPKTGITTYTGIAGIVVLAAFVGIIIIKRKNK